jgi:uncharacterized protein (TIGR00369 family)
VPAVNLPVEDSPFHRLIGLTLVRAEPGEVEMRLPWREEFRRAEGSDWYHGGVLSALIDIAGDYAIASKLGRWVATIDLRVDYLRPAREGALTALGRAVRSGGPWASPTSSCGTARAPSSPWAAPPTRPTPERRG